MRLISIVIPYYNDALNINKCIDSIERSIDKAKKTWPDLIEGIEIIVVDDHSPESFSYPEAPLPVNHVRLPVNNGVGTARNKGAEISTGEYLLFVDSDIILDENHFSVVLEEIRQKKDLVILQGPTGSVAANYNPDSFQNYLAAAWNYYEEQNWKITVFTQCFLIKKKFFRKMGGFIEKFDRSGGEEFEFALRLGFVEGNMIKYRSDLIHFHHFDKIVKRLKKVYFRSRYITEIALEMPNLPVRFKIQALIRSLYCQMMNLSLILTLISPFKGLILWFMLAVLYFFSDWSFSKHVNNSQGGIQAALSVFYRQAEYSFINLGMLSGFINKIFNKNKASG